MDYTPILGQIALNNSTNATISGLSFVKEYVFSLPVLIRQGDVAATIIALIVFFILLVIVNKLSTFLLAIIRRTIILAITMLILYAYVPVFLDKIAVEGFTIQNIVIGIVGGLLCLFAFLLAIRSLLKDTKQAIILRREEPAEVIQETSIEQPAAFESFSQFAHDKSIHQLLIYTTVAQFGVFSSVTLAAPNIKVGITMLTVFFLASLVFIKQSYKQYKIGLVHLAVAFGVGVGLSLLLGVFWSDQKLSQLLSLDYFKSDSLVALITGMAVSLFAGSKN
ncbi:hypothetical protein KY320_01785 [Candidatus Woesearchaeota archaeon]|nr:hypothetical protein [Candidatus Woesearchaeota archaeon]